MTANETRQGGPLREGRPVTLPQRLYRFLVSPKLAIALLIGVLACCLVGVTVLRGARAGQVIFSTLWFNALLVLLAVSSASAFFTRIWRRKLTLVSVGMILFHVCFAAMLGGIVYNRLFFFRGVLRLTEGETLPNGQLESYDWSEQGRFFDRSRLPGETTLVRMHRNYKVGSDNKRAAYEIAVDSGDARVRHIIYPTEYLDFDGVRFFSSKEGYAVLLVRYGKDGRETWGGYVPLQSYRRADQSVVYATGSSSRMGPFDLPPPPEVPEAQVQLVYSPKAGEERTGRISFDVLPLGPHGEGLSMRSGDADVGAKFDAGEFSLAVKEVRYWVGMDVRHDPGLVVILSSLCLGLVGMVMTFVGRLRQGAPRKTAA